MYVHNAFKCINYKCISPWLRCIHLNYKSPMTDNIRMASGSSFTKQIKILSVTLNEQTLFFRQKSIFRRKEN